MSRLKQYAVKKLKQLEKDLHAYKKKPDAEGLHKLRVNFKKIKTLFHLFESSSKGFNANKKFKEFKVVYGKAGRVRDYDVLGQQIKKYRLSCFKKFELQELKDHTKEIKELTSTFSSFFDSFKKNKKEVSKYSKKIGAGDEKKFYRKKEKELRQRMSVMKTKEQIHNVRKSIKELLYLSKVYKPAADHLNRYKMLQEEIGSWLDKYILIHSVKKYCLDFPQSSLVRLRAENSLLLKKIRKKVYLFQKKRGWI
jgi:CHAD domain-containing protein